MTFTRLTEYTRTRGDRSRNIYKPEIIQLNPTINQDFVEKVTHICSRAGTNKNYGPMRTEIFICIKTNWKQSSVSFHFKFKLYFVLAFHIKTSKKNCTVTKHESSAELGEIDISKVFKYVILGHINENLVDSLTKSFQFFSANTLCNPELCPAKLHIKGHWSRMQISIPVTSIILIKEL